MCSLQSYSEEESVQVLLVSIIQNQLLQSEQWAGMTSCSELQESLTESPLLFD